MNRKIVVALILLGGLGVWLGISAAFAQSPQPPDAPHPYLANVALNESHPKSVRGAFASAPVTATAAFSQPQAGNLELVGEFGGSTRAIAAQGHYAYMGIGSNLVVLDVSDPAQSVLVGQVYVAPYGDISGVKVVGPYAYVVYYSYGAGSFSGLYLIDIADPAHPTKVGFYNAEPVVDVAVAGDYAYVTSFGGLRIIDVSNPITPTEVGFYTNPLLRGYLSDGGYIAVTSDSSGTYAYYVVVGSGIASLRILNVTDPSRPTEASFYDVPGSIDRIVVSGTFAYIKGADSLRVIDISNPAEPTLVGSYSTYMHAASMAVASSSGGKYAYIVNFDGLWIINVSDPTHLVEAGFYTKTQFATDIVIAEELAYVATWLDGLHIINVADPANANETGSYEKIKDLRDIAIGGLGSPYAYVADNYAGLGIIDISSPKVPTLVSLYDTPGTANAVKVMGDYAYIADDEAGLRIIDIADPARPAEVGFYNTAGPAVDVAVAGDYAYIADYYNGLVVINIADPTHPTYTGSYNPLTWSLRVAVVGDLAYVADKVADWGTGLYIINISDPAHPTEIGFCNTAVVADSLVVAGDYAYISGQGGLSIINVADPANPIQVSTYDPFIQWPVRLAVVGGYAYLTGYNSVYIICIANPVTPTEVGSYTMPMGGIGGVGEVEVAGNYIYVASNYFDGRLFILQFTPPVPSISGRMTDSSGNPLVGIEISATAGYSATTDVSGYYTLTNLALGAYTFGPATPGYVWQPVSRTVTVLPDAVDQDFVGSNILKHVTPSGSEAVSYSQTLTYTMQIVESSDGNLWFYDQVPTYTSYISGSLNAPPSLAYDPAADAISGTLTLTAATPITVSFAVRVGITGTADLSPAIINRASLCPLESGLADCAWSNQVWNFTYARKTYLPLVYTLAYFPYQP